MCILINDVVEACRPKMDARLQALSVLVPEAQVEVMGDPVRLTQILTNLLDNASKYTPASGRIGIAVTLPHDKVVIAVTDNGIGITEEALSAIFEPFVQEQHATVFNGVGLGIGLTVVRELVEAHGGRVEVSSPGRERGSKFVLTLPLAAQ
jgi:signal transduction histidine kinase